MKPFFQRLRPQVLPRNSRREKLVRLLLRQITAHYCRFFDSYKSWIKQNEPDGNGLIAQQILAGNLEDATLISLMLPVIGTPAPYLYEVLQSIMVQTYKNWELWIITVCPPSSELGQLLDTYATRDNRIRINFINPDLELAEALNTTITMSHGEFIGFLEQADQLAPFALFEIFQALNKFRDTDLFYSDEDHLTLDGKHRYDPIFKPVFSIDYLRSVNYIQHFLVLRKSLGDSLGWLRVGFDDSQNYDLILRAVEQARWVTHIPKVLYHQRTSPHTTASRQDINSYTNKAGLRAVREHLTRCGFNASVENGPHPGLFHSTYQVRNQPLVSIIIPNREHADDLYRCVDSILSQTAYQNYEILIVENNSHSDNILALYHSLQARDERVRVIEYTRDTFNYSEINNYAAGLAKGTILLFLNNDIQILNADWLEHMLGYALRPDVGAVGAKLYFPNMLIQHAGVIVGMGVGSGHRFVGFPQADSGYQYNLIIPQNLSAVTAACLMIRHNVFDEVNSFDPAYQIAYGDIDLCLKLRQKDYLIVWTPYAELIHYESMTRGYEDTSIKEARFYKEADLLMKRWADFFSNGDPYYNPNLTLRRGDFSVQAGICNQAPRSIKGLLSSSSPSRRASV